ncbi:MAG: hypothetical protein FWF69_03605 [Firmicutes bacterium]|nr:hypothetical protein [Bacillota bacterium]
MTNNDLLSNIEYLREKADVSYEEASSLLEQFDGNVMRVLVELERQGRVYAQGPAAEQAQYSNPQAKCGKKKKDAKKQASGFVSDAFKHRVVVENGDKQVVANLSAPYCAGAAILAPWLAVGSVALMFGMGYRVKVKKVENGPMPEDVETFVDKAVHNIKKTASTVTETVRNEINKYNQHNDDDDDEGGEITVE